MCLQGRFGAAVLNACRVPELNNIYVYICVYTYIFGLQGRLGAAVARTTPNGLGGKGAAHGTHVGREAGAGLPLYVYMYVHIHSCDFRAHRQCDFRARRQVGAFEIRQKC